MAKDLATLTNSDLEELFDELCSELISRGIHGPAIRRLSAEDLDEMGAWFEDVINEAEAEG